MEVRCLSFSNDRVSAAHRKIPLRDVAGADLIVEKNRLWEVQPRVVPVVKHSTAQQRHCCEGHSKDRHNGKRRGVRGALPTGSMCGRHGHLFCSHKSVSHNSPLRMGNPRKASAHLLSPFWNVRSGKVKRPGGSSKSLPCEAPCCRSVSA